MIGRRIGLGEINCAEPPSGALTHTTRVAKKVYP